MTSPNRKDFFVELVWPAAAGNVAWAFLTVAISENWCSPGVLARLAVLLLLAVYLAADWLRIKSIDQMSVSYGVADSFHVASIVVFVIAAQLNKSWLDRSLLAVFIIVIVGHLSGAWEKPNPTTPGKKDWGNRLRLAGCNALGPVVLLASRCSFAKPVPWNLPVAVLTVLVVWRFLRY